MPPDFGRLRGVLASTFPTLRAVVIGDLMLDRYVVGEVDRVSPEAPVPVVRLESERAAAGGAANVATNLAALGLRVAVAGWTGTDPEGVTLRQALADAGVDTDAVVARTGSTTTTKTRVVATHQQLVRIDHEADGRADDRADFDARVLALLDADWDVVVLSDYGKGVLDAALCRRVIARAHERELPVLVAPKGLEFSKYATAAAVTPNAAELAALSHVDAADVSALTRAAVELREALLLDALVVTLGSRGMAVVGPTDVTHVPAVAREVFDVSGAGDTAVATLAAGRAAGLAWEEAAILANVAAGVAVGHAGAVAVSADELAATLVREDPSLGTLALKVLDLDSAGLTVERWRAAGDVVGFTNGCFDLLHAGHVSYLDWASHTCDRLVVGLNTDASVRALKGPGRPVVGEQERATVLAGLAAVDAVIVFDDPTPLRLIEALQPDVLVKGGDYQEDDIVGAAEVKARGGRVLVAPLVEGTSTSALVTQIREAG